MIDYKISRVFLYFLLIIFLGCESKTNTEDLKIYRFENEFYKSSEENLHLLIMKYPYLFPNEFPIDSWKSFLKDSTRLSVYKESKKVFKDFSNISKNILKVFQNLEIIFPDFTRPKVITLNSQSEYENRIIYADSLLLVSLDSYLGYGFYPDLPDYISLNMSKEYIVNDISEQIVQKFIKSSCSFANPNHNLNT